LFLVSQRNEVVGAQDSKSRQPGDERGEVRRILLLEDHTILRQTLALVFDQEPEFEVYAQAGTVAEARETLRGLESRVDVGIFDLSLPDGESTELIGELRESNPDFRALVLTASFERQAFARAVEAGAAGVLHKTADLNQIIGAVRRLVAGEALLSTGEIVELLRLASSSREQEREVREIIERITLPSARTYPTSSTRSGLTRNSRPSSSPYATVSSILNRDIVDSRRKRGQLI
jgi:two-component system nitrate/nitrite response regulator NarL